MATLTNTKVKDTYNQLLKTVAGQIGGGFSVVEDGLGNSSGLGLSTSGVGVTKLTFINSPATATTEYLGLFLNSSNEVVQRELAVSAFTQPSLIGGTGVSVSGNYPSFTITNTAPDQTVSFTGTDISIGGAYPNFTLVNTAPDQVVSISGGQDINVTGTYPSFTINHTLGTISAIATDSGVPAQVAIVSANMGVTFEGGTGIETIADDSTKTVTFVNTAPDKVVSITGTNDATVTGTYPNFNIDVVAGSGSGVHEEMLVGKPENEYPIAPNGGSIVAFSTPDNATEQTSYHFGTAPAKLGLTTGNSEVENVSGSKIVVYIDMSAYVAIDSPNSDISYILERFDGANWNLVQRVVRYKGYTGEQVDSFWGIFNLDAQEKLRISVTSDSGNVRLLPSTQIKFQVKELGNII